MCLVTLQRNFPKFFRETPYCKTIFNSNLNDLVTGADRTFRLCHLDRKLTENGICTGRLDTKETTMTVRTKHALAAIVAACTIFSLTTAHAADEPEKMVKFRQNLMKGVGAHITNIAAVVKGQVTITANLVADAQAIADGLKNTGQLFPTGTESGKTNALAKIWEDRAGFDKALADSQQAAKNLVNAATTNDMAAIGKALGALGKSCGACHKPYRKKM